ncbi:MAG: adenylate/guanylate cyclase domain-containing protein [Alphaproteobacteria bacterium]|jgi:class 3 adenylate cyclase|nr:adenylate/guanylate cyclase domain-containing protein [Alphaproteobacteria bacterium]
MNPAPDDTAYGRSVPIWVALAVGVGLLVAAATALVYLVGYEVARRNTVELVRERGGLVVDVIAERVRSHLEPVRLQLDYVARLIAGGRVDVTRRTDLGEMLSASLAAVPQVSVAAFVDPDLRVLRAFRNRPGSPVIESDWSDDPAFVKIFAESAERGEAHWGELFVAESVGQSFINLRLPVRRNGEFLGVLIAGVSIGELSAFLGGLKDEVSYNTFILAGPDRVLAHPFLLHGHADLSDAEPLPRLTGFVDPVLSEIWSPRRHADLEAVLAGPIEARVVDYLGSTYVFMYRPLTGYGPKPWLVGGYLEFAEVTEQYRRLDLIPIFGLIVLALALAGAYVLGRAVSRHVRRLSEGVARIRDLDVADIEPLTPGPFTELNQAARAFNDMLGSLRWFETYVPRRLVHRLMRRPDDHDLASEERELTILFTDIQGFTPLAERLPAAELAALLNTHFTLVAKCIEAEDGTLDKYMGDATMAFWGAPEWQPDHARRAVRAALAVMDAIGAENRRRAAAGEAPVRIRMGLHSGRVVVGNIGAPGRINYTIIGDAVNTAERLGELTREILDDDGEEAVACLSGETAAHLDDGFRLTPLGPYRVRGRAVPVQAYRLEAAGLTPARPPASA